MIINDNNHNNDNDNNNNVNIMKMFYFCKITNYILYLLLIITATL